MALGDLSPDQSRYVDAVARATGLANTAVKAWVGAESGWGVNKAGHNYLNIGPGRTYASTDQAAAAASALVNASSNYAGIRAAIPAGGGAQVEAIGASPWGTSASLLKKIYGDLMPGFWEQQKEGLLGSFGIGIDPKKIPIVGDELAGAADALGKGAADVVNDALGSAVSGVVGALGPVLLGAGLTLIFTVAAFGLIAMGVFRLTGTSPKEVFQTVSGTVGAAGSVAKLAAV